MAFSMRALDILCDALIHEVAMDRMERVETMLETMKPRVAFAALANLAEYSPQTARVISSQLAGSVGFVTALNRSRVDVYSATGVSAYDGPCTRPEHVSAGSVGLRVTRCRSCGADLTRAFVVSSLDASLCSECDRATASRPITSREGK